MALRSSLEGGGGWADAADGWGTGFEAQVPFRTPPSIAFPDISGVQVKALTASPVRLGVLSGFWGQRFYLTECIH